MLNGDQKNKIKTFKKKTKIPFLTTFRPVLPVNLDNKGFFAKTTLKPF